jgi:hypothetical protein
MPEDHTPSTVRAPRIRTQTLVLWFLFLALVVAFATNITQDRKIAALTQDLAFLRQESHKQVADLREAQSGLLEQDLLRLDQVNTQLQKVDEEERKQAVLLAGETRAELTRTVEQRHQEMIRAISDLRADLRSEANAKATQPSVQKAAPGYVPVPVSGDVTAAPTLSLITEEKPGDEPPAASSAQKKSFWSKLNPFGRHSSRTSNPPN